MRKPSKRPKIKGKTVTQSFPRSSISLFRKDLLLLANDTTRRWAKEIEEEAKRIIEEQAYAWQPLKDSYREKKIERGLDPRILIATRDYLDKGIGSWERNGLIFVGPKPGRHAPSGLTYQHLARIHEFGTDTIPARPLWRPLIATMKKRSKRFREEYAKAARLALQRRLRATKKERRI